MKAFIAAQFVERGWPSDPPLKVLPRPPGFFARLIPGASERHTRKVEDAELRHQQAQAQYDAARLERHRNFAEFQEAEEKRRTQLEQENAAIREFQIGLKGGKHAPVLSYFQEVIDGSLKGEPDAVSAELGYSPDSKHLVVDLELPDLRTIPEEIGYKYVKTADRIDPVPRPAAKRKELYSHLICQIALKCLDTVFRSGRSDRCRGLPHGERHAGYDRPCNRTGHSGLPAVGPYHRGYLPISQTRSGSARALFAFPEGIGLARSCGAFASEAVGRGLNMVDPRFIETMDVMSGLDQTPEPDGAFTHRVRRVHYQLVLHHGIRYASDAAIQGWRSGLRRVRLAANLGGKVIIQAKRYKNTVGVSAVRDLFGTVQNEGASKGILVTTSGYGKASFEFARGKPLELLDGGNLLRSARRAHRSRGSDCHAGALGWTSRVAHGE